ncbi:MAG: serine hydrolase, partial [Syntrophothermus sp.]
ADNVMSTMRSIGAKDIKVLRGVEDQKAYDKGLNNTTTAYDLMLIFEKIAKGEIINKSSCQAMMDILLQQKFNDVIPALLPSEVKVAHKTGSITGIIHDSGIVILPNNKKYILVLLSKNLKDDAKGRQMLSEVSRIVYDYMID